MPRSDGQEGFQGNPDGGGGGGGGGGSGGGSGGNQGLDRRSWCSKWKWRRVSLR